MITLVLTTGLMLAANQPLSPSDCNALFTQAQGQTQSTSINQAAATPYIAGGQGNFSRVDTNNDRQVSQQEFNAACQQGLIQHPQQP